MFVGVDVFHAPVKFDPKTKKRGRKQSVAAIIVQVVRKDVQPRCSRIEIYTRSFARDAGREYGLADALETTVSDALKKLDVPPASAVVWRDGIGEAAMQADASEEIAGIRKGLDPNYVVGTKKGADVPLTYIVCQKRIATKFLTADGTRGAPSGTMVGHLQGLDHQTFYINGRAPPNSTPKPTRFVVVQRDDALRNVPVSQLTWGQCHVYPNWTGPVKVPSVCQMAHKLAELAGGFQDNGESIDSDAYTNRVHFL